MSESSPSGVDFQSRSRRLFISTFLAVLMTIFGIGSLGVLSILAVIETQYARIELEEVNSNVESVAKMLATLISAGEHPDTLLREFQSSIQGTEANRHYYCLIDRNTSELLCHPDTSMVGRKLTDMPSNIELEWGDATGFGVISKTGTVYAGILLSDDNLPVEVVSSIPLKGMPWRVNAHHNIQRLYVELRKVRTMVIWVSVAIGVLMAYPASWAARRVSRKYEKTIELQAEELTKEQMRAENLLRAMLPESIAKLLKERQGIIADAHDEVSVLFADIAGFSSFASSHTATQVVRVLDEVFGRFDAITHRHGGEKIKTIGDNYMVAVGLPEASANHVEQAIELALDMIEATCSAFALVGVMLDIRVGLHCGPLVAGVIGTTRYSYDVWGDTVNVAARMEQHGVVGALHCSDDVVAAYARFVGTPYIPGVAARGTRAEIGRFAFVSRGVIQVKGKGEMLTWLVTRVAP